MESLEPHIAGQLDFRCRQVSFRKWLKLADLILVQTLEGGARGSPGLVDVIWNLYYTCTAPVTLDGCPRKAPSARGCRPVIIQ